MQATTSETFTSDVKDRSNTIPVVLLVWKADVEDANTVETIVEELASEISFDYEAIKIDGVEHYGVPCIEDIAAITALAKYKNGSIAGKLFRETDRATIKAFIASHG